MSEYLDIAVKYGRIPGGGEEEVEDFEESDDYEDGDENDEIFRLGDPFPHIEPADIRSVEGKQDGLGLPQGRCLVTLRSGDEVSAVWRSGRREGLCLTVGPSLEKRGVQSIRGCYMLVAFGFVKCLFTI